MKYLRYIIIFFASTLITSCDKPIKKEGIENLKIKNSILNCDEIFFIDKKSKIKNQFYYGEKLKIKFKNFKGFKEKDGLIYPGLQLVVIDKNKDTLLFNEDLYKDEIDGFDPNSLDLSPQITLANPIKSNAKYKVHVNFWDKIGDGNFDVETKITLVPNKEIKIKNNSYTYNEIYLYSEQRNEVILDKKVLLDENIYFIIEGLKGFTIKGDEISLGASVIVTDSNGGTIFENKDILKDNKYTISEIEQRFSSYIIFHEKRKGPVKIRYKFKVWDKNNEENTLLLSANLLLVDEI